MGPLFFSPSPIPETTTLEWFRNHPEWVSILASSVFALVSTCIIVWQALTSSRAQRRQNELLQYQLEYQRMKALNVVREEVLALAIQLRSCLGLLTARSDGNSWYDVKDALYNLRDKVAALDASIYSGYYDGWYASLDEYVDSMFRAITGDSELDDRTGMGPAGTTLDAIHAAESKWNPVGIALGTRSRDSLDRQRLLREVELSTTGL